MLRSHFVQPHKQTLLAKPGSVADLLKEWRVKDLRGLYEMFHFVEDVETLIDVVKGFFIQEGMAFFRNEDGTVTPVAFVEKLVSLRERMQTLLREAMTQDSPDALAESVFASTFEEIVNRSPVVAENASLYLDHKLRSQCTEEDLEHSSENVLMIFSSHARQRSV